MVWITICLYCPTNQKMLIDYHTLCSPRSPSSNPAYVLARPLAPIIHINDVCITYPDQDFKILSMFFRSTEYRDNPYRYRVLVKRTSKLIKNTFDVGNRRLANEPIPTWWRLSVLSSFALQNRGFASPALLGGCTLRQERNVCHQRRAVSPPVYRWCINMPFGNRKGTPRFLGTPSENITALNYFVGIALNHRAIPM